MGILSHIKHLAPLSLYIISVLLVLRGLTGDGRWALLLITFLVPLRNIIERIENFPWGNQIIDLLIGGAAAGWIISAWSHNRRLFAPSSLNRIAVVLVVYTFISLLIGNYYLNGDLSFGLYDFRPKDWKNFCLMPLLFFVTLNHVTDRVWINRILIVMALGLLLAGYYTIFQIHEYSSLISRDKIHGTFEFLGPNEVAAFFNQYTIIIMAMFFCLKGKLKWPLLGLIFMNLFCIIFLYSRASYLGFLAGMAILFLLKDRKLFVLLILAAILWKVVLPPEAVQRIENTTNQYGQLDESSERRLLIWHEGMDLFKSSPVLGIGYGVFKTLGLELGDTHNIYIKVLVEQGLIGMVIFLIVIFCFLRMGYVLYKKGEDDLSKGMGLGLMVCLVTLLINNFFGDRWTYFELSAYLWIFAGLVARLILMSSPVSPGTCSPRSGACVPKQVAHPSRSAIESPAFGRGPAVGGGVPGKTPFAKQKVRFYDL